MNLPKDQTSIILIESELNRVWFWQRNDILRLMLAGNERQERLAQEEKRLAQEENARKERLAQEENARKESLALEREKLAQLHPVRRGSGIK